MKNYLEEELKEMEESHNNKERRKYSIRKWKIAKAAIEEDLVADK